jgi:hypothetical protein
MTALRKYIKSRDKEKLWIKIERTRGDTETFSVEGYEPAKNRLDDMQASFGPTAEYRDFIVEGNIPDMLDLSIDTYCIDGKYPSRSLLGNEQKDEGYIGVVKDWKEMPTDLVDIYDKLASTLKEYQYRNFLAFESRAGQNKLLLGDPCMRVGSPIFELELEMMKNLPDILWQGAEGKMVDPDYAGKYGFEILVKSPWVEEHPLLVKFPDKYRDQIKFRYAAQYPDGLWILPQQAGPYFAAIVAYGDNLDDCIAEVKEISDQVKGTQVEAFTGCAEKLKENIAKLREWGIMI